MDSIAERNEPEFSTDDLIADTPSANHPRNGEPQDQVGKQIRRPDGPRQPLRDEQTQVGEGSNNAHRARPTDLVVPKSPQRLGWIHGPNNFARKAHFATR